jgi:hypothetical protein
MSELGKNMRFAPSSSDKGGAKEEKSGSKEEKSLQHKSSTLFASMNSYMKKWSGAKAVPTDDYEGGEGDEDKKGSQEDFEAVNLND